MLAPPGQLPEHQLEVPVIRQVHRSQTLTVPGPDICTSEQEQVHRVLSGRVIQHCQVEGRVTEGVADVVSGTEVKQHLYNPGELGGLGDRVVEDSVAGRAGQVQVQAGVASKELLQLVAVSQLAQTPQVQLQVAEGECGGGLGLGGIVCGSYFIPIY